MNKAITDVITSYKSRTADSLKGQQTALIPTVDTNILECRVFEYLYDTRRTLVNNNSICFRCRYMYLKNMEPRKYIAYSIVNYPVDALVVNGVISPFLLFINDKMVPWSMIRVIMSHENYFIRATTNDPGWLYEFQHVASYKMIKLPDSCVYIDRPIPVSERTVFGFDNTGLYNGIDPVISIVSEATNMHFDSYTTTQPVNAFAVHTNGTIKFYPENVVLFRKGLLDTASSIKFESALLTVGDGTNTTADKLDICVFRDIRTKNSVDNIAKANLSFIKPFVEKQNAGVAVPKYINELETPFNFAMSRNKDYATNVNETITKIMSYNASFFEEAYMQNRHMTIEERTGQWVLNNTRTDGTLKYPRKHGEFTDQYVLMLVNGEFYKYYHTIKYYADYCIIPIKDILATDAIEFLVFEDVNNNRFNITVVKNDVFKEFDENYINNDMVLFSTVPDTNTYQYPLDGLQHFPVAYTIEHDASGKARIVLTNEMYYGKPLMLVYKNQYHHYWYDMKQTSDDHLSVDLGTNFMYCNDYNKFYIFYNGRKLSSEQYRLTIPCRSTNPFSRFEIYLALPVAIGDRVDIIYTPALGRDIILAPEVTADGNLSVDKSAITYSLDKKMYMVWINGKKIPMAHIQNIDSNHIKIVTDQKSTKTVAITKFIADIDDLTTFFNSNTAIWDTIMSQLTDAEKQSMLDFTSQALTNTEASVYANAIPIRSIMMELIREKYLMNTSVDITGPFVYDYGDVDKSAIDGVDKANNLVLGGTDANATDNINDIKREWP